MALKHKEYQKIPKNTKNTKKYQKIPKIPKNTKNTKKYQKYQKIPKIPRNTTTTPKTYVGSRGSTVVEHLPHHPKDEGLSPTSAADTGK